MEDIVQSSPNVKEDDEEEVRRGGGGEEENMLQFLDSMDSYLTLMDTLSSTLRQGWLELASARHSMGSSRISSALFDLKPQSAATTLQVAKSIGRSSSVIQPHFTLSKWASLSEGKSSFGEVEVDGGLQKKSNSSQLWHRGPSHFSDGVEETNSTINDSPCTVDNHNGRSKSLSVFGTLVSPKLRAGQVSFETALETLVEIANIRSMMLSAFSQLQQGMEGSN